MKKQQTNLEKGKTKKVLKVKIDDEVFLLDKDFIDCKYSSPTAIDPCWYFTLTLKTFPEKQVLEIVATGNVSVFKG